MGLAAGGAFRREEPDYTSAGSGTEIVQALLLQA
jgi:hypothetical protein